MTHSIVPIEAPTLEETKIRRLDQWAKQVLFSILRSLRRGRLNIIDGDVRRTFGGTSNEFPLEATITVHHPRFYSSTVFAGSIGASEAYMAAPLRSCPAMGKRPPRAEIPARSRVQRGAVEPAVGCPGLKAKPSPRARLRANWK